MKSSSEEQTITPEFHLSIEGYSLCIRSVFGCTDNRPSIMCFDGLMSWAKNGTANRDNGPVKIDRHFSIFWKKNGQMHRENGPAVVHQTGQMEWWLDNKLHRIDGPAIIRHAGCVEWFISGNDITDNVEYWMDENDITYPFTTEELMLFQLQFVV